LFTTFNGFYGKPFKHIYQGLLNYELNSVNILYLIHVAWFIQNQIKGGSASAHIHSDAKTGFVDSLSRECLLDIINHTGSSIN